jgi:hypothetical protein
LRGFVGVRGNVGVGISTGKISIDKSGGSSNRPPDPEGRGVIIDSSILTILLAASKSPSGIENPDDSAGSSSMTDASGAMSRIIELVTSRL